MAASTPEMPLPPDENMGPTILASTLTMIALALVTMGLRLYVRGRMMGNLGLDDYTMTFAMLLALALEGVIVPEVFYGAGRHRQYIPEDDHVVGMKLNFITQCLSIWGVMIVKVAIGLFLLRIATVPSYRRTIWGVIIFMVLYTVVCFFTIVFQCSNPAILWDITVKATCMTPPTLRALSYLNTALNITTDLLFSIFLPIPMLWSIQMNNRTKISVVLVLSLGVFASAAALVKSTYIKDYGKTGDFLWDSQNLTIWTMVEICVGIIAGNLPCLKPLFRRVLDLTSYGSGSNSRSKGQSYGNTPAPSGRGTHDRSVNRYSRYGDGVPSNDVFASKSKGLGGDETYMMTRISAKSKGDDADSKMSDDSISALEQKHGIVKTVDTRVSYGLASDKQSGKQGNSTEVLAPERRVEDRI